jgi:energy-coupling factor transport system ATP-binding protein
MNAMTTVLSQRLVAVLGPNFSGRTDALRAVTGELPATYLGPEIANYLTGLAPSVDEELTWGRAHSSSTTFLIEKLRLHGLLDKNPSELSGGEQALVAIASACIRAPNVLAIDCVFEQLNIANRVRVIDALVNSPSHPGRTYFVDNRLKEYLPLCRDLTGEIGINELSNRSNFAPHIQPTAGDLRSPIACRLSLQKVRFAYKRGKAVLKEVTFTFEPGTIYILRGENGAGKTTLAKLMLGNRRPLSGDVYVDGNRLHPWREPSSIVAYHYQHPDSQLFATTVREEVALSVRKSRSGFDYTPSLLSLFGLESMANEHPLGLPFVLRKRIALAVTLGMGRPWVILDEPTLGQDEANCDALAQILRRAAEQGQGVIVITHSDEFACKLLGKILILEDGVLRTME